MARKPNDAIDKVEDSLDEKLKPFIGEVTVSTKPVVITGVQRKVNIGNYETIDIYCAVSIPQDEVNPHDLDALSKMVQEAADIGFTLTSNEVLERYKLIKEKTS